LQWRGDVAGAAWCFRRALELNPLNVVASINLACNNTLQAGGYKPFSLEPEIKDKLNQYRTPDQLLSVNGPFDEPRFNYQEGIIFSQSGNYRQAARAFNRVIELTPKEPSAYGWLAQIYNLWQLPERALALVQKARALSGLTPQNQTELTSIEATAYFTLKDFATGEKILEDAIRKNPDDEALEGNALSLLMTFRRETNALELIERQLARSPDNVNTLNNKAVLYQQLGRFTEAVPPLDRVLELQPDNHLARLNRAIALLQSNRLEESRRDYEILAAVYPSSHQIYYGLGEIAYRRKEWTEAADNYARYLTNAPPDTAEAKTIQKRLAELKTTAK
jgi:tetratricopeptide (TPR) repeat protein